LKILIVTQYFFPENFRINDFAREFQNRGHTITILTGIPNYPGGRYFDGYGVFKKKQENYFGVEIYRSPLIPRGSGSSIRLVLNYLSFVIGSIWTSHYLLKKQFDVIFVHEPSPITVCLPAIFIKKIKKIPICLWVLDLWPESVVSAGNLKTGLIPIILNPLVKYIYRKSDKILVSSRGFINSIKEKGVNENKIDFFPQWAEPIFIPMKSKKYLLKGVPENSFKIMFAGNIGEAQDFSSILETANQLKHDKSIQWVILGGGRKVEWVRSKIKEYNLEKCFHLLGGYTLEEMPEFYSNADVMLFSLKDEYIFSLTIPAKVQSYLACGKPILAMVNGEGGKVVVDAKAGYSCAAESPHELGENIIKMKNMGEKKLSEMGENARKYYDDNFERSYLFEKMENTLRVMCESF
jgi:colanic acid biosynthesis glycosyl transferase WcaI